MGVAVMGIGEMGMLMLHRLVAMAMSMHFARLQGQARLIHVLMPMVCIVHMIVLVVHRLMGMQVPMVLRQM